MSEIKNKFTFGTNGHLWARAWSSACGHATRRNKMLGMSQCNRDDL